jgi:hypothetical protein
MLVGPTVFVLAIQLIEKVALSTPLSVDLANSFLATVAQVLAGMLAIVFSVSVLAIEITSDRYSPCLFSYFIGNPATWLTLVSHLVCILLSVIAIGVQEIPMFQLGFLAMVWLFVLCLMTLPYYFEQTLHLLDPRNLARQIGDDGLHALKKQDKQKASEAITSLGDVAVKAFGRGEDNITKRYLDALEEMQRALVGPDTILLLEEVQDVAPATMFGFGIPSPVVDQYLRIFKAAVEKNSQDLSLSVANCLGEAVISITQMNQDGSMEILRGVLHQYQEFVEIAIKNRDISRFGLVRSLRELIFNQTRVKTVNGEGLSVCLATLEWINRMIVNYEDSELWKKQLDYFGVLSIEQVCTSLPSDLMMLLRELHWAGIAVTREKEQLWYSMAWPMVTRITSTNKRVFELGMSEIEQLMPSSERQFQEQAQSILDRIQVLWATTGIYDVFFRTCVYAFYRGKLGYVKELWRHVNPPDASASWGNANLIHLNIGFLTHQTFYNTFIGWSIDGYHGAEMYVLQYYLLCLAHTLQQPNRDWHPIVPPFTRVLLNLGDEYSAALGQELSTVYAFLVNLPHYADKALKQYEAVVSMSGEWDDVLDGRGLDALEQARKWLENTERRQEWKEKAESIIKNLPLDNSRIEAYKKAAMEYYQSESYIDQLATTGGNGEKAPTELRRSWRSPEKRDFTLIGLGKPQEVGRKIGFGAVDQIVRAEVAHIVKIILEQEATDSIGLKQLAFNEMAKAVKKIDEAGHKATVLLAPSQQISSACQNDPDFRTRMTHEGNDRYMMLNDSTRLRILELDSNYALVLDSNAGIWSTVEPLKIEVAECARDPLAVQITAQEVVDYQVLNPGAVEILKFG